MSFVQIYLGDAVEPDAIAEALQILRSDNAAGQSVLRWANRRACRRSSILHRPTPSTASSDKGFFEQLAGLPTGTWDGPVVSAYGTHLVLVHETIPGGALPFDDIQDDVLLDWRAAKLLELRERFYAQLRDRYVVERYDPNGTIAEEQ
jgi:hypothetical protein